MGSGLHWSSFQVEHKSIQTGTAAEYAGQNPESRLNVRFGYSRVCDQTKPPRSDREELNAAGLRLIEQLVIRYRVVV